MPELPFNNNGMRINAPLAFRMRPKSIDDFLGQEDLIGPDKPITNILKTKIPPSIIFWGPPGTGKTTLAYLIASQLNLEFKELSATSAGKKDIFKLIDEAKVIFNGTKLPTCIFIDEIHRFNKVQQDSFLPFIEDGTILLFGATTENPSFEIISALLSRCRIFTLKPLSDEAICSILNRALTDKDLGLGLSGLTLNDEVLMFIASMANGDARSALNILELINYYFQTDKEKKIISVKVVQNILQKKNIFYDKNGESHYNIISAFHKSMRGSDPQATVYWLVRMLEGGEDPLFIARRIIRAASEDVGLADPNALPIAISAMEAVKFVGLPEANLALVQAALYIATAPKSNTLENAYNLAKKDVYNSNNSPVPIHLRNPVTSLMKKLNYGKDYKYPHNFKNGFVKQEYLPENLINKQYYSPTKFGFEKEIKKRLEFWDRLKNSDNDIE